MTTLGKVRAEMISVPFGTGVICIGQTTLPIGPNNCSNGQTMMLSRPPSPSLMVFRKPGWLGSWGDAGALNSSVWAAFGKSDQVYLGKRLILRLPAFRIVLHVATVLWDAQDAQLKHFSWARDNWK